MLKFIPRIRTKKENEEMEKMPSKEEVKLVTFTLTTNSVSGPDSFSGQFFQSSWDIVGEDITNMVICHTYQLGAYPKEGKN